MKKITVFVKCISWLFLFGMSQFFLFLGMKFFFDKSFIHSMQIKEPQLQEYEYNVLLQEYKETNQYQKELEIFIKDKAYIVVLVNSTVTLPIILYFYLRKWKIKNSSKKYFFNSAIIGLSLSLFLNIIINWIQPSKIMPISFWMLISTGIIGPILEELVFRGILYETVKKVYSKKATFLIITILFALLHRGIIIVYAFIMGSLFLYLKEKTNSIKAPITAHIISNFFIPLCTPLIFQLSFPIQLILFVIFYFTFLYFFYLKKQNI